MTNYELIKNMSVEEMAATIMCQQIRVWLKSSAINRTIVTAVNAAWNGFNKILKRMVLINGIQKR